MSTGLLIADTGPLIALAKVALLDLPGRLYERAAVPVSVYRECLTQSRLPDARLIEATVAEGLLEVLDDSAWPTSHPQPPLDRGETAVIALAIQLGAHVLIDELRGRRVATRMGVPVVGVCGLLLVAKKRLMVDTVAPLIDRLRESGYFISPALRHAVLTAADETS